jgi:hypothetical protein
MLDTAASAVPTTVTSKTIGTIRLGGRPNDPVETLRVRRTNPMRRRRPEAFNRSKIRVKSGKAMLLTDQNLARFVAQKLGKMPSA